METKFLRLGVLACAIALLAPGFCRAASNKAAVSATLNQLKSKAGPHATLTAPLVATAQDINTLYGPRRDVTFSQIQKVFNSTSTQVPTYELLHGEWTRVLDVAPWRDNNPFDPNGVYLDMWGARLEFGKSRWDWYPPADLSVTIQREDGGYEYGREWGAMFFEKRIVFEKRDHDDDEYQKYCAATRYTCVLGKGPLLLCRITTTRDVTYPHADPKELPPVHEGSVWYEGFMRRSDR